MEPTLRYEIVDTIASGDFATVYRARDRDLGREVAIKQIHQQFLTDQRQLGRYWQEAQLLASLQHPNIVTIYDIARSRGWLILELMRGSLKQTAQGEPIDLDFLRVVLSGSLNALHFLHQNGVIHGDIKPSNLLVDGQHRVKLGDFGLARRASNEEGSLLKGTTKYMAPELINPQFGPVGPASDIYSLGFTAYELICGAQFESLFPGLGSFGRDKQIAWMMWHAAADRKLPQISKVLEGVPDDLAQVVEKMIVKDPARRYQSAVEVLRDLRPDPRLAEPLPVENDPAAEAARIAAARRKRRLRYAAVVAMAFSIMLCLAMLLPRKPKPHPAGPPQPISGVIANVYPDERKLEIFTEDDNGKQIAKTVLLRDGFDSIFINDKTHFIDDLQPKDDVVIKLLRDNRGRPIQQVWAYRPDFNKGHVKSIKADEGKFMLAIDEGDEQGKEKSIVVPGDLEILLNGKRETGGKPVRLADLRPGDKVDVSHIGAEQGRKATKLKALRVVETKGVLTDDYDAASRLLSITTGTGAQSQVVKFPFAEQYIIVVNGQPVAKPTGLKKGDEVTVEHDIRIVRVEARRTVGNTGVVRQLHYEAPQTMNVSDEQNRTITYITGPQCKITLGDEPAGFDELRVGDHVRITHGALDPANQEAVNATAVAATRPADPSRWAILIGAQDYDDHSLTRLDYPLADVKLLADALVKRYKVPAEQAVVFADESLVRLEQAIPDRLAKLGEDAKLLFYVTGHAYKDDQGAVYLAPKNFDFKRPGLTGLGLQWLVDQLEKCPAKEKLLLLDCSQAGAGTDLAREPSSAEMLQSLKTPPGRAPLRTVWAVASCRAGQRGQTWPSKGHGLFAWCLAEGYTGRADTNRDGRIEPTELFGYLQGAMSAAGGELKAAQTPQLFRPDDRPLRLSDDAKKEIRKLASLLRPVKTDIAAARDQYIAARHAAGKELEPRLLYVLLLVKAKDSEAAMKRFEALKAEKPDLLLPLQGLAWLRFQKRSYTAGMNDLVELIGKIPQPAKPGESYSAQVADLFKWVGQLRQFAATAEQDAYRPAAGLLAELDAAVAKHGGDGERLYQEGRDHSTAVLADFEQQLAGGTDPALVSRLKVERHRLVHYAEFPFEQYAKDILAGLDQQ